MDSYRTFRHAALIAAVFAALLAVLFTGMVVTAAPAAGNPRDDQQRVEADMAKAGATLEGATERARLAAQLLVAATAALPAAQDLVAQTLGQLAAAETVASTARRKAAGAQVGLDAATGRYAEAQRRVDAAHTRAGNFIVANYKGGDLANLNMLLGARGPIDAAERYGYFQRIMQTERAAMNDLTNARLDAKQVQNEATLAQRVADQARAAAEAARDAAHDAHRQAEAAAAEAAALIAQRTDALAIAEQERSASLARYRQATTEGANLERHLAEWESRIGGGGTSSARFLMPVHGWKSSDYGMRYDPYYKVWQLHAGMDIAAGGGQPVHAAADGIVILAGWNGGAGNLTCLSHGRSGDKGLSSCYAHQSSIAVRAGQRVRAGQVIGRVGTTGASTGNHLHFEVRLNGTPTDPLPWLPTCLC